MIEIQEAQFLWFIQKHNAVKAFQNIRAIDFIQTIKRRLDFAFDNNICEVLLASNICRYISR